MRDGLAGLVPYDPDMRDVEVMLSANENSFGLAPEAWSLALERIAREPVNRYPDATARRLRGLLADMTGVPARDVVVGNGGDELIFNLLLAFGGPGRTLLVCPPAFSAYALYARLTSTDVVNVPRRDDFSIDEQAVMAAARRADVVMLTSPNNPTGGLVRRGLVEALARATDALVVVDEAYVEFAGPGASCADLVEPDGSVCVLRTLSKAYALAGARVGYALCPDAVADALLAVRLPYSVSRLDQAAAEAAVESRAALAPAVEALRRGRADLLSGLQGLAARLEAAKGAPCLEAFPSEANFILVRLLPGAGVAASEAHERLASDRSVLVRDFSSTPGLEGCLRVTVGTPEENARLLGALEDVVLAAPAPGRPEGGSHA